LFYQTINLGAYVVVPPQNGVIRQCGSTTGPWATCGLQQGFQWPKEASSNLKFIGKHEVTFCLTELLALDKVHL